ncbi:MAG: hypothetical protein NC132_01260 [Corallococcus sp.]|nr:hypothetical protein [Corallococcus sp.]MCM1359452.1 hypothetical protein [Corallococcus sp.]MCM1394736.1 hypothetical protein [Corallococcus sp.]
MKIFSDFSPIIKIILWILFALSIAALVLSVLVVSDAAVIRFVTKGQGWVLLFTSTLAAVISVLLATIHYQITKTHLRLNLAFFDILGGRIRLENILNIVIRNGKMYISYIWKGEDPVIAQIAVKPKHFDKMKDALMKTNPRIVFFDDDADGGKE